MVNVRALLTVIFTLVVIHIIAIGLFANNWVTFVDREYDDEFSAGLIEGKSEISGFEKFENIYDDGKYYTEDFSMYQSIHGYKYDGGFNIYGLALHIILWISLVFCIGAIVFTMLNRVGKTNRNFGPILGYSGAGLILLVVIAFLIIYLVFRDPYSKMHMGWTFYLVIFGGILQIINTRLMKKVTKEDVKKKWDGKAIVAVGLTVLVVHIVYLGLFTNNWANGEAERGEYFYYSDMRVGLGLREWDHIIDENITHSYDLSHLAKLEVERDKIGFNTAGLTAYIILWIAFAVCIGSIVFTLSDKLRDAFGKIGTALRFAGGGLIILAAVLWLFMIPDLDPSLRIGWTFYAVMVGGFLQIGSGLIMEVKKEESKNL